MGYYSKIVDSMFTTYPALGSYINRAGRLADIGEDAILDLYEERPENGAPTLTDARLGMLARQNGYANDNNGMLMYINSIITDSRFADYTEAYAKEGKNAFLEYRYTAEQSMGMETAFDKIYNTETHGPGGGGVVISELEPEPEPWADLELEPEPEPWADLEPEPVNFEVEPVERPKVRMPKYVGPYTPEVEPVAKPVATHKTLGDYVLHEPEKVKHDWQVLKDSMAPKRTFVETVRAGIGKAGNIVAGLIKRLFGRG